MACICGYRRIRKNTMTKCVYCRAEIRRQDLSAKLIGDNNYWCNRCKEGCFLFYEHQSTEDLLKKKTQLIGTVLYYNTNVYLVQTEFGIDLYRAELDNKLQEIHNISIALEQRHILGVN